MPTPDPRKSEARINLRRQVEDFEKSGGVIEKIAQGVSGETYRTFRQVVTDGRGLKAESRKKLRVENEKCN